MATREKRLAQFDGNGDPPPDQPVEVLCEDHSGTYQLPFACRWIDGQWRNDRTGGMVEATVVGLRLPRSSAMLTWRSRTRRRLTSPRIVPECDGAARDLYVRNSDGTNRARITDWAPYSVVHG